MWKEEVNEDGDRAIEERFVRRSLRVQLKSLTAVGLKGKTWNACQEAEIDADGSGRTESDTWRRMDEVTRFYSGALQGYLTDRIGRDRTQQRREYYGIRG